MSTKIRCLLAENDGASHTALSDYIDRHADLVAVDTCKTGVEAANVLFKDEVDLLLLEAEMPEVSGLELLESLSDVPPTVAVTEHEEYAVKAFEVGVIDYLVKPVAYPRFLEAIERVSTYLGRLSALRTEAPSAPQTDPNGQTTPNGRVPSAGIGLESVFLKDGRRFIRVELGDIQWIKAKGDYMLVRAGTERHMINSTMKELEEKLPSDQFVRIHRSHIVRIDQIKNIEGTTLTVDGKMLPIGPSYRDDLLEHIPTL